MMTSNPKVIKLGMTLYCEYDNSMEYCELQLKKLYDL